MEVHWRNVSPLARAARARIEARLRALAEGRDDLIGVHISAKTTRHHVHGGCEVTVQARAHGRELVATRSRPDLGQALDEAIDAFEHELRRVRDRLGARVEAAPSAPEFGVIDRVELDEGYGFILTDAGERIYFHRNALRPGLVLEALEEGQRVGLNFEAGEKGLQATFVAPAPDVPPV